MAGYFASPKWMQVVMNAFAQSIAINEMFFFLSKILPVPQLNPGSLSGFQEDRHARWFSYCSLKPRADME